MSTTTKTIPPANAEEINLAIVRPLISYFAEELGRPALDALAVESALSAEDLLRGQGFVPLAAIESIFEAARKKLGSDAAFLAACTHNIVKSYGLMALAFRASTVLMSYRVLAKTMHFVSKVSTYEVAESTARSVVMRYRSERTESRLMCLSRQAQLPTMPLIWWGLEPARLVETKCIARGDDCCEYHLRWSEPLAWRWPAATFAAGMIGMVAVSRLGFGQHYAIPIVGFLLGAAAAFRRMVTQGQEFHAGTTDRVAQLVEENQGAVEEIISLHQRQEAFNALLAERMEARTSALQAMITELKSKGERSEVALRGATHDIRNPLQVALLNAHVLTEMDDPDVVAMGKIIFESTQSVEKQMKRMLDIATANDKAFALKNERMEIAGFVERVRKNLQALVIARDIRVSVFKTREAPEAIETDTMLFDRVIDNVISNAVKYTDRGSIVIEVGGVPDHLTFKISDTGRGISAERLEKVFVGGQRDKNPNLGESHGIGLSSAIRLLDEIGGRLEVMSKPDVGTTIWAHVPVSPPERDPSGPLRTASANEVLKRVVTIRNAANG
jgi:signal transduction histidine kinase